MAVMTQSNIHHRFDTYSSSLGSVQAISTRVPLQREHQGLEHLTVPRLKYNSVQMIKLEGLDPEQKHNKIHLKIKLFHYFYTFAVNTE